MTGDPGSLSLEVASRTDRGVSARANALTLRSSLTAATLLRSLNGIDPNIFFTAATPVPEEFRARHAVRRTYRYFEAAHGENDRRAWEAAPLFRGTVDVRSLGRSIPSTAPSWRAIESVTVRPLDGGWLVEVRAPAFVWGMVRKIVAALRQVDAGRLSAARLRSALEGKVRLTLPMAEPEPLVLWEVEYDLPWTVLWRGPNRGQAAAARAHRDTLWVRSRLIDALPAGPGDAEPSS